MSEEKNHYDNVINFKKAVERKYFKDYEDREELLDGLWDQVEEALEQMFNEKDWDVYEIMLDIDIDPFDKTEEEINKELEGYESEVQQDAKNVIRKINSSPYVKILVNKFKKIRDEDEY